MLFYAPDMYKKIVFFHNIKKQNGAKCVMLLVKNGTIHPMTDVGHFTGDILVADGKIKMLSAHIDGEGDLKTIDARGLNIYPGFIDAHSHIGIMEDKIGKAGDDCNESTNPVTPRLRAIDAINPLDSAFHNALSVGVTSVMAGPGSANPIGGQFACIKTYGRRIDEMIIKAPAAIKMAFGENPKNTYGSNGNMPLTRMAIASLIREELQNAKDYYCLKKNTNAGDFQIDYAYEPYLPLFEHKIPMKAHVHRLDDIFTAIRIAEEFSIMLTLDHCTEGHLEAERIAAAGFPAIVGPSLASRSKLEVENSDFKTVGILQKAGVRVAITTDHPVSRIQYLPLCAGLAAKEGLGRDAALRAITIDAAIIAGISERVGSIVPGKDADLVLYDGDPLEISGTAVCTIINSNVVMDKMSGNL